MPKRSIDATASPNEMPGARVMRKTERSHEENQERAYIAASRRADRSIEARVQSAKMASEIHKKRTGKGFKVSEEIVIKEEMYEEDDDDLPRPYRQLAAHLQTSSPEMNDRLSAYLSNSVAMASLARQREVDRMFAEAYPNANKVLQQMTDSMYHKPLSAQDSPQSPSSQHHFSVPTSPNFAPMSFGGQAHPYGRDRSQSISSRSDALSPRTAMAQLPQSHSPTVTSRTLSGATPSLSQGGSGSAHSTPQMNNMPAFDFTSFNPSQAVNPSHTTSKNLINNGMMPTSTAPPTQPFSFFTSELPSGVKQLASLDMSDPLASAFMGTSSGFDMSGAIDFSANAGNPVLTSAMPPSGSQGSNNGGGDGALAAMPSAFAGSYFDAGLQPHKMGDGGESGTATPNWDSFVNADWAREA